jgi:hypothetical protein
MLAKTQKKPTFRSMWIQKLKPDFGNLDEQLENERAKPSKDGILFINPLFRISSLVMDASLLSAAEKATADWLARLTREVNKGWRRQREIDLRESRNRIRTDAIYRGLFVLIIEGENMDVPISIAREFVSAPGRERSCFRSADTALTSHDNDSGFQVESAIRNLDWKGLELSFQEHVAACESNRSDRSGCSYLVFPHRTISFLANQQDTFAIKRNREKWFQTVKSMEQRSRENELEYPGWPSSSPFVRGKLISPKGSTKGNRN